MDHRPHHSGDPEHAPDEPRCAVELHLRLCARRLTTGHLQFRWRAETVDNLAHDGSSLEGIFGPFQMPHECGQDVAALVREWIRKATKSAAVHHADPAYEELEGQLTMTDLLQD